MSSGKRSLVRQLKDRENRFFSGIRFIREHGLKQSRENYSWETFKYKIYPSSLSSLYMCPKKFIEEDVHKPPSFGIDQIYRMEVGTALHRMYQDDALRITNLLWEKPTFKNSPSEDALTTKMAANWPEVPVYEEESGISGRADLVLNVNNEIVVFDIKTTSVDKTKWDSHKTERLPSPSHILQVSIYIYLMNKYKYYSKPIKRGALGYVNIAMLPGEEGSEHEAYFDYTDQLDSMVGDLIAELTRQRNAFINKKTEECNYKFCRLHSRESDSDK